MSRRALITAGGLAAATCLWLPSLAGAQVSAVATGTTTTAPAYDQPAPPSTDPRAKAEPLNSRLDLEVSRVRHKRLLVGNYVKGVATLRPFVAGEKVVLIFRRNGHTVKTAKRKVQRVPGRNSGRVRMRTPRLIAPARYRMLAVHHNTTELEKSTADSPAFHLKYVDPHGSSRQSGIFNELLNRNGYANAPNENTINDATKRAVLAFRKVNGMARTMDPTSGIFRDLAAGKGAFHPKYPGAGKHVEVDISRQVMSLIEHGRAHYTYHVSTGAPATPTIRGHFQFYRKEPGLNSHGMYYSVYFEGGYATHGYASVPTYNASHGCVRNPIPDSRFIYDWINLGDDIWVYG